MQFTLVLCLVTITAAMIYGCSHQCSEDSIIFTHVALSTIGLFEAHLHRRGPILHQMYSFIFISNKDRQPLNSVLIHNVKISKIFS